jgi:DUF1009 family protein
MNLPRVNSLGLIAGNGTYPLLLARAARAAGVERIVAVAFHDETDPALADLVDEVAWLRVGQLGKMIAFFKERSVPQAIMAGQIAPGNLFNLRPDIKALLLLGRLKRRNAESIFGAIGEELAAAGVTLLPATTFMDRYLAPSGHIAGPRLNVRLQSDVTFGFQIAREISRLDIGQTAVVKNGTVLAVEGFEGTSAAIRRGGELGKKNAVVVKVSKPNQDLRFDVPVIGPATLEVAREARIAVIAVEAGKTLLLDQDAIRTLADQHRISIIGASYE